VIAEDGWSDDGTQSVVTVDPDAVHRWVESLLQDQDEGKTAKVAYTRDQTTVDVANDSSVNGLAGAVSDRLTAVAFKPGAIGNNDKAKVDRSQVQAAAADDLGAQAVAQELGGLPIVADPSIPAGTVRVVLAEDYQGPGSGLDGTLPTAATIDDAAAEAAPSEAAPPSPVITAGSDDPKCVN
jgi:hypothetical protein